MAAIFLVSLYLFGATDAYQLLKLPALINHYIEHRGEDPSMNFISFIHLHYQGKIVIDADFQQDMKLPFKTTNTDCCVAMSVATVVPTPIEIKLQTPEQPQAVHILSNDDVPLLLSAASIFQPPRV
ncbi:hypothetical protein FRZ67_22515 [Panacibacter ginsenosidivorans]|uniref:Uncharacterized protein n=1 Tax=Panacibacter ginsenosidivorans TaxID=1813871 RepID=A0A5B8VFR8_9BACT|nr:hypothetical protein [Panacibacter ginsenosidivorans]QEC69935.1 hypothetical protein FRZ67_22515 [Panacibacter ginsenosidivorans]